MSKLKKGEREGPSDPITYRECGGLKQCCHLKFRRSGMKGMFFGCAHPEAAEIVRRRLTTNGSSTPKAMVYQWLEIRFKDGRCVTPFYCPYLQEGCES